jgi:hypothetical protein
MQGYSNVSVEAPITVHYNGKVEASLQSCYKGRYWQSITVRYNGKVEASMQGIISAVWGPP